MLFLFFCCTSEKTPDSVALLSTTDISIGTEQSIAEMVRIDPTLMHSGWTHSMQTLSDNTCPPMEIHNGMDLWRESCTTEDGHQFLGWSLNFRGRNIPSDCCMLEEYDWLSGQAQIINADTGTLLQNFGDILHQKGVDSSGNPVLEGFVYGDFYWDDPSAENSWLLSDISMEYYYTFTQKPQGDQVDLQAWLSYFSADVSAAIFESVFFDASICKQEPVQGEIWIRDNTGRWYALLFDGETSCDGCGAVFQQDQLLGDSCVDFSPLFNWDEFPWENR